MTSWVVLSAPPVPEPLFCILLISLLEDVVLTPDDVANVLRTLDNDKAHGPDGIPARLLTETASQIAPSLCQLFNKSLRIGVVPFDWKLANVVPAHKKRRPGICGKL